MLPDTQHFIESLHLERYFHFTLWRNLLKNRFIERGDKSNILKKHISFLGVVLMSFLGLSQTGPGGIGTNDGTSSLVLWLDANDLDADGDTTDNPVAGNIVSTWNNKSGVVSTDWTQTIAIRQPIYATSVMNGHPAVTFDGNDFLNGPDIDYNSGEAVFFINASNFERRSRLLDNSSGGARVSLRFEQWNNTGRVGYTRYGIADYTTGLSSPFNQDALITFLKQTAGATNYNITLNTNGNESSAILGLGSSNTPIPTETFGNWTSGNVPEIIVYNNALNTAERIILYNYLVAKYGIVLQNNDLYVQDNPGNGNFDHDVAGIGQAADGSNHTDSQGTGIVRISGATNLDNNEFLIWGHDNGNLLLDNTADVPSGQTHARLHRIWRVSESNTSSISVDVGAVDVRVDMTGVAGYSSAYPPQLLVDTDNDSSFDDENPLSAATSLGGNVYRFNGVTLLSDGTRFTFAIGKKTTITNRRVTYRVNKN